MHGNLKQQEEIKKEGKKKKTKRAGFLG